MWYHFGRAALGLTRDLEVAMIMFRRSAGLALIALLALPSIALAQDGGFEAPSFDPPSFDPPSFDGPVIDFTLSFESPAFDPPPLDGVEIDFSFAGDLSVVGGVDAGEPSADVELNVEGELSVKGGFDEDVSLGSSTTFLLHFGD